MYIIPQSFRSCSGFTVISYSKDNSNTKILDKNLKKLFEEYEIFKNNSKFQFDLCERQELKGYFLNKKFSTDKKVADPLCFFNCSKIENNIL